MAQEANTCEEVVVDEASDIYATNTTPSTACFHLWATRSDTRY